MILTYFHTNWYTNFIKYGFNQYVMRLILSHFFIHGLYTFGFMYYIIVILWQFWTIILMFQSNYVYSVSAGIDLIHDTRHLTSERIYGIKEISCGF